MKSSSFHSGVSQIIVCRVKKKPKKKPRTVACAAAKFLPKSRRGDTEAINLDKRSKEDIKEKMTAWFLGCDLRS